MLKSKTFPGEPRQEVYLPLVYENSQGLTQAAVENTLPRPNRTLELVESDKVRFNIVEANALTHIYCIRKMPTTNYAYLFIEGKP